MTATVTTPTKTGHPRVQGFDRWSVTGEHGKVEFDELGPRLSITDANGDTDASGDPWLARVSEYAGLGDDDAVFAALADLYDIELAGGAR